MIFKLIVDWLAMRQSGKKARLYYFENRRDLKSNLNLKSESVIMNKQEVLDLVEMKKSVAGQPFDEIKAAVDSIEIGGDVGALMQQIADLQSQVSSQANQINDLQLQNASLQQVIAQIRAILGL